EVSNLTNVYNGIVNLYAVWVKEGVTYQVRYNANGGIISPLELTSETNHWIYENGVYKSGNKGVSSSTSTIKSKEFTLTETGTISFDWAVSSEGGNYDYLYYSIYKDGSTTALDGTGTSTKIGGYKSSDTEGNLTYTTVTKKLEAGTYTLEFNYIKDTTGNSGLDTGYVKNILIPGFIAQENSNYQTGTKGKLSKNKYEKQGYTFKGWSTKPDGNVKYNDEEEIIDLAEENNKIVDLYAAWESVDYEVNVVVQNGIINGEYVKTISYNKNASFNIIPSIDNVLSSTVECTNGQIGVFENNKVTVKNITNDTTCTAAVSDKMTTLYEDGTLIINELYSDRSSNIATHGNVKAEYDPISDGNSYVFNSEKDQPWDSNSYKVKSVEIGETIKPISTAHWFYGLEKMEKGDFTNLDTSKVTNMEGMFDLAGRIATTWSIGGLSSWNTSNVTSMRYMFYQAGASATTWSIGDLSSWNTSKVTNMYSMFTDASRNATTWSIGDLSAWDTSNVTDMSNMFRFAGGNATTWNIGDLSGWDTSNVTNMGGMFNNAGYSATTFNLDLSNWDTSKVTDMSFMFDSTGRNATTFNLDLSSWNTSNVTDMSHMFDSTGRNATTWNIRDLSGWDTSKVTDLSYMFDSAGSSATTFSLDLSNWNTSKVTNMKEMFSNAGSKATTWTVKIPSTTGNLSNTTSKWYGNTESVYAEPCSGKYFTLS
ncbi:MAG: BspA family leucine-rich repeat surface protein, partial [bacterium]|nr:BspA family leucine-rich repeat surface protein [bacterium]